MHLVGYIKYTSFRFYFKVFIYAHSTLWPCTNKTELHLWLNQDASRQRVYSSPRFDPLVLWLWSCPATSNRVELDLYRTLYCWIWGRSFSYSAVASLTGLVGLTCVIVRTADRRLAMCCAARWSCKMCGWERWKNCSVQWTAGALAVHKPTVYNVLYQFPSLSSVHISLPLFITSLSSTLNTHFRFPFPSYIHHLNKYLFSCTSQNKIGCLLGGYGKYVALHWQSVALYVPFRS